MGKLSTLVRGALALACGLSFIGPVFGQNASATQWPLHDDGFNEIVQWDHYSFEVNGKRIFIFSGEFHYWRLPVPELWEDILVKIKAAGCNVVSIYGHWGFHSASPGVLDFETAAHDPRPIFEIAKRIGLWVTVRPGPYVNAESNAGGFPGWLTTGAYGTLRNNDTRYTEAWTPYQSEFAQLVKEYQVTYGQNALLYQIENEYGYQWTDANAKTPNNTGIDYMELLEANARDNGITIPSFHNNPNMNSKSWSMDYGAGFGGNVDAYGVDSYPACWSCYLPTCASSNGPYIPFEVQNYYEHFQSVAWTQPEFMPEFQGGSYNPWNGPAGGCVNNTDWDFANLYYRHNIAERVSAMSLYMFYGGTNWGWLAFPLVGTSYDYSGPIAEDRSLRAKYSETKNLALFTRVAEDLRVTERLGNSTSYSTNANVMATELRNPDTNGAFYVTVHANTSMDTVESFQLKVNTSIGALTVPRNSSIILNGYQSKIIVTDFRFGSRVLTYSTAEVLTYAILDGKPVLALWVPDGESGEFHLKGGKSGSVATSGSTKFAFQADKNGLMVSFRAASGVSVVQLDQDVRVMVLDRTSAYPFWVPGITADPHVPVDQTVLVQGPYLVRSAAYEGSTIQLTGDSSASNATVEVFASSFAKTIIWNGKALKTAKTRYCSLRAQLPGPNNTTSIPALGPWKVADSLPERLSNYDDTSAAWVAADHTTTPSVYKNATLPYLYVDEYGFHYGIHLWRGRFTGTSAKGVFLDVQGGNVFGWSAYLNGQFLGSFLGDLDLEAGNLTLSFSNATLNSGENILFVIQDNSGHDETDSVLNPRGIMNATLLGASNASFTSWKVAGTAGGEKNIDPVRGPLNEGGLTAERLGWHLPGFTGDSNWTSSSSISFSGDGVKFFRSNLPLNIPSGLDVSLAFRFSAPKSNKIRVLLFVNGYQYARFNPYVGNEVEFPVPVGIFNYDGDNTIGVAVWAQSEEGAEVGIELVQKYAVESGFDVKFDSEYLRPGWTEERLEYV